MPSTSCDRVLVQIAEMICTVGCAYKGEKYPVRVAIDGVDGAGKTFLADQLTPLIENSARPVIRASIDGFHNHREIRYQRGADSPEGYYRDSFDYERLRNNLLIPLGPGGNRKYRPLVFNVHEDSSVDNIWCKASANAVLLFDGVFLLRPELFHFWEFSIFVHADFTNSVPRAVSRDFSISDGKQTLVSLQQRYERRYVPGQKLYIREARPRERASIIVDNNDYRHPILIKGLSGM